jgi:hypothetical protein
MAFLLHYFVDYIIMYIFVDSNGFNKISSATAMAKEDYIERTLIKLKRQYSKDELVAALLKQISEKDIELGKLSAEIDYLQNELQSNKEQKEINRLAKVEARKEELYRRKVEDNQKQRAEIKQLRAMRSDLIAKNYALQQKVSAGGNCG